MIVTASELSANNVPAGDLKSLLLYIDNIGTNGELISPTISLKTTADSVLNSFHQTGFTEVYNISAGGNSSQAPLIDGPNEFFFHTPFTWNGTDNIIIEFYFENETPVANSILFENDANYSDKSVSYNGKMAI